MAWHEARVDRPRYLFKLKLTRGARVVPRASYQLRQALNLLTAAVRASEPTIFHSLALAATGRV
ncbi:MAG: hypothetical protein C0502_10290 [Opitutus sp.]|nr:hypothetical protein [Opitutus sp.]